MEIVEIEAVRALRQAHEGQLVKYRTATGSDVGLLLTRGAARPTSRGKPRALPARGSDRMPVRRSGMRGSAEGNGCPRTHPHGQIFLPSVGRVVPSAYTEAGSLAVVVGSAGTPHDGQYG